MKLPRVYARARFIPALSILLSLAFGCGGEAPPAEDGVAGDATSGGEASSGSAMEDASRWPREFVTGPGGGPALYLSADPDAAAVGYVSPGVTFRIAGFPSGGRIPVRINAGLKVKAWLSTERVALYVQQAQRIEGTPTYLGAGDAVQVLGPDEAPGMLRVEVTPDLGRGPEYALPSFPAVIAESMLGTTRPADAEPVRPGPAHRLPANTEVQIYARPDQPIATIPAMELPPVVSVLQVRGSWKKVLVGTGPYMMGYVNVDLTPVDAYDEPLPRPSTPIGEVPLRLQNDQQHPLWRIAPFARVRSHGRIFAVAQEGAYARELERFEDDSTVDVFVAIDDEVAVRGLVRIRDLQPVETAEPPSTEEAQSAPTRGRGPTRVGGGANDYLYAVHRDGAARRGAPTEVGSADGADAADHALLAENRESGGGPLPGPPQPQPASLDDIPAIRPSGLSEAQVLAAFQNSRALRGADASGLWQLLLGDVASSLSRPDHARVLSGAGVNLAGLNDPLLQDPFGALEDATREIHNLGR